MKSRLKITKKGFELDGKDFYLASGDIHYFRIYPTEWRRHLKLAKEFGLTAIQTYVPWNLHEEKKGKFNFSGTLDICAFLELADEMGLKVLLRPSPYLCSECDFGGLPAWLLQEKLCIRCSDDKYLSHVRDYYDVLIPKIVPYLSTNGGPIIMTAVENEYGGSGYDKKYMETLMDMMAERGVDVPFYTTDNTPEALHMGSIPGVFLASNFRSTPGNGTLFADYEEKQFPQWPFMVGELWSGRAIYWGEPYKKRDPEETAKSYEECLNRGFVNFYMFSGGTNFGFFSGAVVGKSLTPRPDTPVRYIAHTTSYDEDALVSENGIPTEKYYLCRNVLRKHLGLEKSEDRKLPFDYHVQEIDIKLTKYARMFDNLDALTTKSVKSASPLTMEEIGEETGFMLYSTVISGWPECGRKRISFEGVSDKADFYDGRKYIGSYLRDRACQPIYADGTDRDIHLDILVESVARVNGGRMLDKDPKGLTHYVAFGVANLYGFETRALPMKDLSAVSFKDLSGAKIEDNDPVFYRGSFCAEAGVDTFLDMRGWGRGFVVINGFNIGRYWEVGPQYTLYVPGGLLKEKDNDIIIFDVNHKGAVSGIKTVKEAILEGE